MIDMPRRWRGDGKGVGGAAMALTVVHAVLIVGIGLCIAAGSSGHVGVSGAVAVVAVVLCRPYGFAAPLRQFG